VFDFPSEQFSGNPMNTPMPLSKIQKLQLNFILNLTINQEILSVEQNLKPLKKWNIENL
jgi:hypothetical protein